MVFGRSDIKNIRPLCNIHCSLPKMDTPGKDLIEKGQQVIQLMHRDNGSFKILYENGVKFGTVWGNVRAMLIGSKAGAAVVV